MMIIWSFFNAEAYSIYIINMHNNTVCRQNQEVIVRSIECQRDIYTTKIIMNFIY